MKMVSAFQFLETRGNFLSHFHCPGVNTELLIDIVNTEFMISIFRKGYKSDDGDLFTVEVSFEGKSVMRFLGRLAGC